MLYMLNIWKQKRTESSLWVFGSINYSLVDLHFSERSWAVPVWLPLKQSPVVGGPARPPHNPRDYAHLVSRDVPSWTKAGAPFVLS